MLRHTTTAVHTLCLCLCVYTKCTLVHLACNVQTTWNWIRNRQQNMQKFSRYVICALWYLATPSTVCSASHAHGDQPKPMHNNQEGNASKLPPPQTLPLSSDTTVHAIFLLVPALLRSHLLHNNKSTSSREYILRLCAICYMLSVSVCVRVLPSNFVQTEFEVHKSTASHVRWLKCSSISCHLC